MAGGKKKAVIFFPYNPHPFASGNQKRVLEIIKALSSKRFEVYFLSADFFGQSWNEAGCKSLEEMGVKVSVYPMSAWERKWVHWVLQRYNKDEKLILRTFHLKPPFMKRWFLRKVLEIQPEAIWVHYAYWGDFLKKVPASMVRTIESNDLISTSDWLRRRLEVFIPPGGKIRRENFESMPDFLWDEKYWESQAGRTDPYEFKIYDNADCTVAISKAEAEMIRRNTSRTRVVYVPHYQPAVSIENRYEGPALFPSGNHVFNFHGYFYFIKKVWPLIRQAQPDFKVQMTGNARDLFFDEDGIEKLGFLPDLQKLYAESCFAVCPIISGTGQSLKIVEAMAHGLPAVATRFTAVNSPIVHGENGFIAEDAETFSEYCVRLWKDRDLCRKMGEAARRTIQDEYKKWNYESKIEEIISPRAGKAERS